MVTSFRNLESLFRRDRDQPLDDLPADPAGVVTATHGLLLAGAGPDWWPYAVLVSPDMVAVHLAGARCPAPKAPWRPGPDPRLWLSGREEIRRTAEHERLPRSAPTSGKGPRPVLLGVYEQGLVYIDVARAPGPLVVSGAEPWATKVRELLDAQLTSEALVLEQTPERLPDAYWPIRVFDASTISMLGCALAGVVRFPELMRASMAQRRALALPPTPAAAASAQALTRAQIPAGQMPVQVQPAAPTGMSAQAASYAQAMSYAQTSSMAPPTAPISAPAYSPPPTQPPRRPGPPPLPPNAFAAPAVSARAAESGPRPIPPRSGVPVLPGAYAPGPPRPVPAPPPPPPVSWEDIAVSSADGE